MEIRTDVYRGVGIQPGNEAGNIKTGLLQGDACMRQIENGNGAPMGTEFPPGRKASQPLANARVENMQPAGVPNNGENLFGIDQFFSLIQASGENGKRQIVMYEREELNHARLKRGHCEGVQLGQPGRDGTWKSGLARNAKTWQALYTALQENGIELTNDEKNRYFGDAWRKNKPMTVAHLKNLQKDYPEKRAEIAKNKFFEDVEKDPSGEQIMKFYDVNKESKKTVQNTIKSIFMEIDNICTQLNERNRKSNEVSNSYLLDKQTNKITPKSLKNGIKDILIDLYTKNNENKFQYCVATILGNIKEKNIDGIDMNLRYGNIEKSRE